MWDLRRQRTRLLNGGIFFSVDQIALTLAQFLPELPNLVLLKRCSSYFGNSLIVPRSSEVIGYIGSHWRV